LLIPNFVPFLRLAILSYRNGKRRFFFSDAAVALGDFFWRVTPRRLRDSLAII